MTKLTQAVTDQGYQYYDWNVLSGDAGETKDTDKIVKNVIDGLKRHKDGYSIVLQHDIHGFSVAAVERIIVWGLDHGYTFLPLTSTSPTAHQELMN
jgi:peptidoglycan/xylan/chitin deacetylase (PgdA/CDA1 family)